jgi:hypothetical protein
VRSLPRRVVLLRADATRFSVPTEKLRDAMLALVPAVQRPAQKLALVARAGVSPGVRALRRELPAAPTWATLLREAPADLIDQWAPGWYAMVQLVPAFHAPAVNPLAKVPLEEQVLLFAILDLSRRRTEGIYRM